MQKDFHYYCVGILARAAGFNTRDALIIAYASQYVDDSTESKPIKLKDEESKTEFLFDPVRTAHTGLKASKWSIHKRVFIPFHFIPPEGFTYTEPASYFYTPPNFVTRSNSHFANKILRNASRERNEKRRLCRIGIALHTFADTWSHTGFSGRNSKVENSVKNIHIWDRNEWHKETVTDKIIESITDIFAGEVGHCEAGYLPDLSFLRWKYKNPSNNLTIEYDNHRKFYDAARIIYDKLCCIKKAYTLEKIPWNDIKNTISELFAYRGSLGVKISFFEKVNMYLNDDLLEERCTKWKDKFKHYFDPPEAYHYDRLEWRDLALNPNKLDPEFNIGDTLLPANSKNKEKKLDIQDEEDLEMKWKIWAQKFDYDRDFGFAKKNIDWDDWDESKLEKEMNFFLKPCFPDSLWVHFHRAAMCQRAFVLQQLP